MDQNNQNAFDEGISLTELFSRMWKQKIMILIVTLAVALVTILAVILINPRLAKVNFNMQYSFISTSNNTYPDGTYFNYQDLVNSDYLTKTKNSNEAFKNVDINELLENNVVTITKVTDEKNIQPTYYTFNAQANYFGSTKNAQNFIKELIKQFENRVILEPEFEKIKSTAIKSYETPGLNYDALFDAMLSEYNVLVSAYKDLEKNAPHAAFNGKLIGDSITELELYFRVNNINLMKTDAIKNNYVKDSRSIDNINLEIERINLELAEQNLVRQGIIDAMNEINKDTNASIYITLHDTLVSTTVRIANLNSSLNLLKNRLLNETRPAADSTFVKSILSAIDRLESDTAQYNSLYAEYSNQYADIRITNGRNGKVSGSISIMLAAVAGIILGGGASSVVAIVIEGNKKNKAEAAIK